MNEMGRSGKAKEKKIEDCRIPMAPSKEVCRKRKRTQFQKHHNADDADDADDAHDSHECTDSLKQQPMLQRIGDADWWYELLHRLSMSPKDSGFLLGDNPDKFKTVFRVSRKTFDYICSLVKQDLASRPPSGLVNIEGRLLPVEKQVAIALRRLASGDAQVSVGEQFGVGQSTVSQVTWRFVESMEERGRHHLKWPDDLEMEKIKAGFQKHNGLPNCCGAIDVTHIIMTLPAVQSSLDWSDHENNYSMVLQGIVDSEMRFRDILTGWPGGVNASGLLQSSGFFRLCENEKRLNGPKQIQLGREIREYIAGDIGYPLLPWLLTPFTEHDLSVKQKNFNAKHAVVTKIAEKALARLKGTWRILHKVLWRPDKHKLPRIILVCCLLHNIILDQGDELQAGVVLPGNHDEGYKKQICPFVDTQGKNLRDSVTECLSRFK